MAISTALIGKLGGGVETQTVSIDWSALAGIPAGWRKAAGIFTGTQSGSNDVSVFGDTFTPSGYPYTVNGGGAHSRRNRVLLQCAGHAHVVPARVTRKVVV